MKVIIFGNNLQNTLGLIRSVGMKGYEVILLLEPIKKSRCYVRHSKYISKIHYLKSVQEGIDVLLKEYGNEPESLLYFVVAIRPFVCWMLTMNN